MGNAKHAENNEGKTLQATGEPRRCQKEITKLSGLTRHGKSGSAGFSKLILNRPVVLGIFAVVAG